VKLILDQYKNKYDNPIIIGGTGGSGTRAVAEILRMTGIFLGKDLNNSFDEYLFTYLFKHPKQFLRFNLLSETIDYPSEKLLELHNKLYHGLYPKKIWEWWYILKAGWYHTWNLYNLKWVFQRWRQLIHHKPNPGDIWGWKSPFSIFFLPWLKAYYPAAKYILVLRNGLDMIYSKNDQQFRIWSPFFKIDPKDKSPKNRFEFWYQSNKHAISVGQALFDNHFYLIKFENLCLKPRQTIKELSNFVGLDKSKIAEKVFSIPELPKSFNRYLKFDTSWIDSNIKDKLTELGYKTYGLI
jgi:hypothetical protein